jgi:DNA polymerase-4
VPDRQARSISHEQTFATDVTDREYLRSVLLNQTEDVARRLRRHGMLARTVTVKIRRHDFHTITRQTTLKAPTDRTDVFWQAAAELFDKWAANGAPPVRLLGMGVSQLSGRDGQQLSLFEQGAADRRRSLDRTVDRIRQRYGRGAISRGVGPRKTEQ